MYDEHGNPITYDHTLETGAQSFTDPTNPSYDDKGQPQTYDPANALINKDDSNAQLYADDLEEVEEDNVFYDENGQPMAYDEGGSDVANNLVDNEILNEDDF